MLHTIRLSLVVGVCLFVSEQALSEVGNGNCVPGQGINCTTDVTQLPLPVPAALIGVGLVGLFAAGRFRR